jgi:hypothetical protein
MPPDTETTYPVTTGLSKLRNALTADCTALTNINNNNNQPKKTHTHTQKTEGKTLDLRSTTTCDEAEIKRTEMSCCKSDFRVNLPTTEERAQKRRIQESTREACEETWLMSIIAEGT